MVIDADGGVLNVEISDAEMTERRKAWKPKAPAFKTDALACYAKHVGPARYGELTTPDPDEEVRCDAEI